MEYAVVTTIPIGAITPQFDTTQNGDLSIKGSVLELNTPIPCRVRLFEKVSGRLIADKLTDIHGNYEFDHLTKTKFFIVAHHPASQFNAVIQDNMVPK